MTEVQHSEKLRVNEIIVVEGIHDKQLVERVIDGDIFVLGGDRISHNTRIALKRAAEHRGVIVLTDPDGAGERIRRRLDQSIPGLKHAYVPRRKAISEQGLGIEHTDPRIVRAAVAEARSTERAEQRTEALFEYSDLVEVGFVGTSDAAERRTKMGAILGIGYGNAKAFLHKLNQLGVTRDEWNRALERLHSE